MEDFTVHLTSDLTSSERRLSPDWTVEYFKHRVELITGIPPEFQKIWIYRTNQSNDRHELDNSLDVKTTHLDDLNISPSTRIHVENTSSDPDLLELQKELLESNSSNGGEELFKLNEQRYDELPNTVKKWKKESKLGRYDPKFREQKEKLLRESDEIADNISVDDRCKLSNKSSSSFRLGTVRYVGKIPEINDEGTWVGVELDEPFGKNDGSIKGKRYFTCRQNYGSFVRPFVVETGDFPPETLNLDGSDEDEL
ncbi:DEKNAAC102420 [Brettanomyces naardenensis]|uniref:DEKNAAC102420 n=1 Tax=Brettanomyces naardenensis TaxID=13370 RepID=A0A448YKH7_BRENA|nr:DEKNAAC102420 [Brettanomyces naardenensis]